MNEVMCHKVVSGNSSFYFPFLTILIPQKGMGGLPITFRLNWIGTKCAIFDRLGKSPPPYGSVDILMVETITITKKCKVFM